MAEWHNRLRALRWPSSSATRQDPLRAHRYTDTPGRAPIAILSSSRVGGFAPGRWTVMAAAAAAVCPNCSRTAGAKHSVPRVRKPRISPTIKSPGHLGRPVPAALYVGGWPCHSFVWPSAAPLASWAHPFGRLQRPHGYAPACPLNKRLIKGIAWTPGLQAK